MLNRISSIVIAVIFLSALCAQIPSGYEKGLETLSVNELEADLQFLASDALAGRPAGSNENLLAGIYIARAFKQAGLVPLIENKYSKPFNRNDLPEVKLENAGDYQSYFQYFNIQKSKLSDNNKLALISENGRSNVTKNYLFKGDFYIDYDGLSDLEIQSDLVFTGFGIDNGIDGYDDFIDAEGNPLDLTGKTAVIIDGFPQEDNPESEYSKMRSNEHRIIKFKVRNAQERGALAVIIIQSPLKQRKPLENVYNNFLGSYDKESTKLHASKREYIPVVYVSHKISDDIFEQQSDINISERIKEMSESNKSASFEIKDMRFNLTVDINYEVLTTQNVVGFIEGSDPELRNEVVVFGAHYDHVGLGYYGSLNKENKGQIHNGADDNASGTAGLIEMAESFAANPPARSTLFIAFNAEENGLLGSRYYVYYQPLIPLENTVAMINLDMIGRNEPELLWLGGAFQGRDIIRTAQTANEKVGFELLYNVGMLGSASDQAHFLRKEIPAIFFFTGLHEDYHTPSDDIDKLDFDKMHRVTKLAFLTGWILTNQKENPKFERIPMDERKTIVQESGKRMHKYRDN